MIEFLLMFILWYLWLCCTLRQWWYRCCSPLNCNKILDWCSQIKNPREVVPMVWPWKGQSQESSLWCYYLFTFMMKLIGEHFGVFSCSIHPLGWWMESNLQRPNLCDCYGSRTWGPSSSSPTSSDALRAFLEEQAHAGAAIRRLAKAESSKKATKNKDGGLFDSWWIQSSCFGFHLSIHNSIYFRCYFLFLF